jgi:hypothetical protein
MTKFERAKPLPYPAGPLTTPISWQPPQSTAVGEIYPVSDAGRAEQSAWDGATDNLLTAMRDKLDILAKHYGLRDNWDPETLLLLVCKEFIPGFERARTETQPKSGRPLEWDAIRYTLLLFEVEMLKATAKGPKSDSDALRILISTPAYEPDEGVASAIDLFEKQIAYLSNKLSDARREMPTHDRNGKPSAFNPLAAWAQGIIRNGDIYRWHLLLSAR